MLCAECGVSAFFARGYVHTTNSRRRKHPLMTYMVDGRQYIVATVGWDDMASELVALALP